MGEQLDHIGYIDQWHEQGYTGQGVTVWVMEPYRNHSRNCRKRINEAAPDARVIIASTARASKNGIVSSYNVIQNDDGNPRPSVPVEQFIRDNGIKVISASVSPSPFDKVGTTFGKFWEDLIERYDLCCFSASGNDSDKDRDFKKNVAMMVGALDTSSKGETKRAGYSNGGEGLDFAESVGWWAGTSSATPYLAGKCALVRQRFPHFDRFQVYDYMINHCQDLGDDGVDKLFGNGLFVLPPVEEEEDVEITKTKILVDDKIIEVKRVMVNNENYIRLRDFDDVLHICKVDYDKAKNLPIVKKG